MLASQFTINIQILPNRPVHLIFVPTSCWQNSLYCKIHILICRLSFMMFSKQTALKAKIWFVVFFLLVNNKSSNNNLIIIV